MTGAASYNGSNTSPYPLNRVYAAVRVAALDPYPGFLHTIEYGRYSLVLDLKEEFRTIIADTLALSLFNLKILKKDDFYVEKPEEGEDPGLLPGQSRFIN